MKFSLICLAQMIVVTLVILLSLCGIIIPEPTRSAKITCKERFEPSLSPEVSILVDDFEPQPLPGDTFYFYNRLGGDRGRLGDAVLDWGRGEVTTTLTTGGAWGGVWFSLNHLDSENLPMNLSAVLPHQVNTPYQSQVTDLNVTLSRATPGTQFKLELKDDNILRWNTTTTLNGSDETLSFDLPVITETTTLLWVLESQNPGDFAVIDRVWFSATLPMTDVLEASFVWSYGMLLNNLDLKTGLVRDRANFPSGAFDAVQATGSLASATAQAEQLGMVSRANAIEIVEAISDTLLSDVPRYHGLLPHFVEVKSTGLITIATNTEWSSVDTTIALVSVLEAQQALGLDSSGSEQALKEIDWADLLLAGGISHGYSYRGERLNSVWDIFGGESWLVGLAYVAATDEIPPLAYPHPPTANGSGFIDEMAWLWLEPPNLRDAWGVDWNTYRQTAADGQTGYYHDNNPQSCLAQQELFGLSAGEVPLPESVSSNSIYQAFGVGGRFSLPNDGTSLLDGPVITPHYTGLIASLRPQAARHAWSTLIEAGTFSPLNNVESLMYDPAGNCNETAIQYNHLKGSWNLALQTLGLGRALAQEKDQAPILWQAAQENDFLASGYRQLTSGARVFLPFTTYRP